jgi:hypothetical protein
MRKYLFKIVYRTQSMPCNQILRQNPSAAEQRNYCIKQRNYWSHNTENFPWFASEQGKAGNWRGASLSPWQGDRVDRSGKVRSVKVGGVNQQAPCVE